jgi:hypothetical protein
MNKMYSECHGHIFMNGEDYQTAVDIHKGGVNRVAVRENLEMLRRCSVTYFRDGGDALGVSRCTAKIAGECGIDYVTPVFAIHRKGYYGGIVGFGYDTLSEYRQLVARAKDEGCDFVKLMFSGLVCFDDYGHLSCPPLPPGEIRELVHTAHSEGFRVMAHVNGADAVRAALEAGTDSIEHGYYMDGAGIDLLAATGAVWVPTFAAIAAFVGRGGCSDQVTERILARQAGNLRAALSAGALVATGSDSGAVGVPHGEGIRSETRLLSDYAGEDLAEALAESTRRANRKIRETFRRT